VNLDRGLAVAGVLLGLPAFLLLFLSGQQTTAILVLVLAFVLLASAFAVKYLTGLPPLTMKSVDVVLQFNDGQGKNALLSKHYQIRATRNDVREMTHRNIASDGGISNICWNDQLIPAADIKRILGQYEVTVRFALAPRKWKTTAGKLSYNLTDSFNGNPEGLMYVVDFPARLVRFRIELPGGRRCLNATAYKLEGAGRKPISDPSVSDDRRVLLLAVKKPPTGSEYAIYWTW